MNGVAKIMSDTFLPLCRVSPAVKYCNHSQRLATGLKINPVWKPLCCHATQAFVNHWVLPRVIGCKRNTAFNLSHEFDAKIGVLGFVPGGCFNEF